MQLVYVQWGEPYPVQVGVVAVREQQQRFLVSLTHLLSLSHPLCPEQTGKTNHTCINVGPYTQISPFLQLFIPTSLCGQCIVSYLCCCLGSIGSTLSFSSCLGGNLTTFLDQIGSVACHLTDLFSNFWIVAQSTVQICFC